jgi:aldose 1-epimerase
MIDADNELLKIGKGYDQNFVLSKKKGASGLAVFLTDPRSGRYLKLFTNEPGLQFYSANYLDGSITGKSGKPYNFRCGVALEPQKYPDSPNHPEFPSPLIEPGQKYFHEIRYVFGVN